MKSIILGQLIAYNAFALNPADCLAKSSTEGGPLGGTTITYSGGLLVMGKSVPTNS